MIKLTKFSNRHSILAFAIDTQTELLDKLVVHGDSDVLCSIAITESTPVDILERLSHDGSYLVRGYVASNPSTPEWLVKKLAKDSDISVRHAASTAAFRRGIKL